MKRDRKRRAWLGTGILWLLAPQTAFGLPVISEVLYDAVGTDNGLSFVELYGEPGTDLSGFTVEGINGSGGAVTHSVPLSGTIPADGLFVLADDQGDGTSGVPGADQVSEFDFQNGPDSVVLLMGATVVDALGYGDFAAGDVFAGEGMPAPDPPAGWSVARHFADVDTDDNAADFTALELPTPGTAPLAIPEPGSGALLAGGLLGLGVARRRPSGPSAGG